MIRTFFRVLRRRPAPAAGVQPAFMTTEAPILQAKDLTKPGVYWYFGPNNELPSLVDVRSREGRITVDFRDQKGEINPTALKGYFDGPMADLPPPSTIAGDL